MAFPTTPAAMTAMRRLVHSSSLRALSTAIKGYFFAVKGTEHSFYYYLGIAFLDPLFSPRPATAGYSADEKCCEHEEEKQNQYCSNQGEE